MNDEVWRAIRITLRVLLIVFWAGFMGALAGGMAMVAMAIMRGQQANGIDNGIFILVAGCVAAILVGGPLLAWGLLSVIKNARYDRLMRDASRAKDPDNYFR
jgi:hypothetical protein